MPNPHRYFMEEREVGKDELEFAVKGEGKERAARVVNTEPHALRLAHHYAGRGGVVEMKDEHGRFTHCPCPRCKANR